MDAHSKSRSSTLFSPFSGWKVLSFQTGGIGEEAHFGNERKTLGTKQSFFSPHPAAATASREIEIPPLQQIQKKTYFSFPFP